MTSLSNPPPKQARIPFWRDGRILGVLAQIIFVILFVLALRWVFTNVAANLESLGPAQFICRAGSAEQSSPRCAFDFLATEAQFEISEAVIDYDTSDSYWRAISVGIWNTAKVSVIGILLATFLGTFTGIARLSDNWLVRNVAKLYIDLMRNTPLLLLLFFLYFAYLLIDLPDVTAAGQLAGLPVFFSNRGINFANLTPMSSFPTWLAFIVLGIVQGQLIWMFLGRRDEITGQTTNRVPFVLAGFFLVTVLGYYVAGANAKNEAILVTRAARIRDIEDTVVFMERRLGVDNLQFLDDLVERGEVSPEEVEAARLSVCVLQESPSEVNIRALLRELGVPHTTQRVERPDQIAEAMSAENNPCELFAAPAAILAAEREQIEESSRYLVVPIPERPMRWNIPVFEGFNFTGGAKLTLEFTAMLVGLTIYTAAFIAEIVRAGILSVGKGQSEAARALGLTEGQRLRLIILPQALRVIIPPMTSQYLNLTKNSSLALAVAFPDLWFVMRTIINQSGRAVQPILLTAGTYLSISLAISFFLNWYNRQIQIVER